MRTLFGTVFGLMSGADLGVCKVAAEAPLLQLQDSSARLPPSRAQATTPPLAARTDAAALKTAVQCTVGRGGRLE